MALLTYLLGQAGMKGYGRMIPKDRKGLAEVGFHIAQMSWRITLAARPVRAERPGRPVVRVFSMRAGAGVASRNCSWDGAP